MFHSCRSKVSSGVRSIQHTLKFSSFSSERNFLLPQSNLKELVQAEKMAYLDGKEYSYLSKPHQSVNNFCSIDPKSVLKSLKGNLAIEPAGYAEQSAKAIINGWIYLVDKMSGFEKDEKSKDVWMSKLVLTEMFLANPLLMGAMVYHTKSVMNPGRDLGVVSQYLTHADNARLSFVTLLEMKNPNIFYRLTTTLAQTIDLFMCTLLLFPAPRLGHRTLAYMMEDAIDVYDMCLEEISKPNSSISDWSNTPAPKFAVDYWKLKEDKQSVKDMFIAIREDKFKHLVANHVMASISRDEMRALRQ